MNKTPNEFYPPERVQEKARLALKFKKRGSKAMTRVGWYRATQLAKGKGISRDIVLRMNSFLKRHEKNAIIDDPSKPKWQDRGYVAYLGWGGKPALEWTERIINKYKLRK
jgi:hypothetical protein